MDRRTALLGTIGGAIALCGQDPPRYEGTLGAALATGDLRDRSRTSLGWSLAFARLVPRAPMTWRFELGYAGFSRSRTDRPLVVRTPSGTVQTTETVEVTRNVLALGAHALWRPGHRPSGIYLGLGAGLGHWYEIQHMADASINDIQRRTSHLLASVHGGFDTAPRGPGAIRGVFELRALRGPEFDGRTATWVGGSAGLRF